jgi:DNA-binding IclR family transcriptional regulator
VTFTDLQRRLGFPKSSLHELLTLLSDRGYVSWTADGRRFGLGIRAWEIGQSYLQHRRIVDEALPAMASIVALLNETVQLAMLEGLENVYLAKVDCTHPVRLQTDAGKRYPAHATALGKVLLAHLTPNELLDRLQRAQLSRLTRNTITNSDELLRELARSRSQGFAVDWEEGMEGVRCVAVPVRNDREVVAAISASIPIFRAHPVQLATALRLLAKESLEVSRRLGCTLEDPGLARLLLSSEDQLIELVEQRAAQVVGSAGSGQMASGLVQ